MSEASKVLKRIDDLAGLWGEKRAQPVVRHNSVALQEALREVAELRVRLTALISKGAVLDPVTQQRRYGASTLAKLESQQAVLATIEALMLQDFESARSEEILLESKSLLVSEPRVEIQAESNVFTNISQESGDEDYADKVRQQQVEAERIAQEAEASRQLRNSSRLELDKLVVSINSCGIVDDEEWIRHFSSISSSAGKFIRSLLGRVVACPNDELLRRIRLSHPAVIEALLEDDETAINMLVGLGWKLHFETSPPNSSLVTSPHQNKIPGGLLFEKLLRLSAISKVVLVLFMEEPSTNDSSSWIAWWDRLDSKLKRI